MGECKPLMLGMTQMVHGHVDDTGLLDPGGAPPGGRGLHSSTFRLNVSTFCGIRWVHDFPPVY